jgi:hypothetical protein
VYAISRLQAKQGTWYWAVHFQRRGTFYYKRFYEPKHGGSKKALAAAIAWRDRQLAKAKALTYREFHQQVRSNNRSGVPGVHFLKSERQPEGIWQAKLRLHNGRKITKTFSVRKFGRREAFARAVAARAQMLARVEDRLYLYHPTAKKFAVGSAPTTRRNNNARGKAGVAWTSMGEASRETG